MKQHCYKVEKGKARYCIDIEDLRAVLKKEQIKRAQLACITLLGFGYYDECRKESYEQYLDKVNITFRELFALLEEEEKK